jgi:serine protease Do
VADFRRSDEDFMPRFVWHLAILCLVPAVALGQPQPAAGPVAPLDVPTLVAKADPAVACILVSRSPLYRKLNLISGPDRPGVLGDVRLPALLPGADNGIELRRQLSLDDPRHVPEAFGTGLIIDPKGLVLTSYHVIRDAVKVFVRWPDSPGSYADILAADPRSDLAVLKLLSPGNRPLPTVHFGNADNLRRGEPVIALSNPYVAGFLDGHASVSVGVVSNLRRRIPGRQPVQESSANPLYQLGLLMQTDARLALGSSGGALLDAKGECIGITTSLAALNGSDVPGGFAVPVTSRMRKIIESLRRGEEVDYGFLGVSLKRDLADSIALVDGMQQDSPADLAGIKQGDVFVNIDGVPIRDTQDLFLALSTCQAGDTAKITVRHGFDLRVVHATLVKSGNSALPPIATSPGRRPYVGGLRVDYASVLSSRVPTQRMKDGVLIVEIQKQSKAAKLGLFEHDIITQVNDRKVNTPAAFYDELARAPGPIVLTVERDQMQFRKNWQ